MAQDASAAMLERARLNLTKRSLDIPLAKVDFREVPGHFHDPFDAVVCLSTSLLAHDKKESDVLIVVAKR